MSHRAHHGSDYAGDWAWTPPAGARPPGEPVQDCARHELREVTGLELALEPTVCGTGDSWVYLAEASPEMVVVVDAEHHQFECWRLGWPARAAHPSWLAHLWWQPSRRSATGLRTVNEIASNGA